MKLKTAKKLLIFSIILLIILAGILIVNISSKNVTGETIKDKYTYTKAICNSTNFCQDYTIECEENKTISISPVTGAFLQNDKNWQDPRNDTRNKLC